MCGLLALLKDALLSCHSESSLLLIGLQSRRCRNKLAQHSPTQSHASAALEMAQQVQAKQRELQSKLEAMLASVEDERLRPMRKQGFLAMAKCCDLSDPLASVS